MTGVETLAWLVLAFADGADCLIQASLHRWPDGPALVREDGCLVHSRQEGSHVVFWSDTRWVAIKIPDGARSLSYRWGRTVAFVNGNSVKVEYGNVLRKPQPSSSMSERGGADAISKWRMRTDQSDIRFSGQDCLAARIKCASIGYLPAARARAMSA